MGVGVALGDAVGVAVGPARGAGFTVAGGAAGCVPGAAGAFGLFFFGPRLQCWGCAAQRGLAFSAPGAGLPPSAARASRIANQFTSTAGTGPSVRPRGA